MLIYRHLYHFIYVGFCESKLQTVYLQSWKLERVFHAFIYSLFIKSLNTWECRLNVGNSEFWFQLGHQLAVLSQTNSLTLLGLFSFVNKRPELAITKATANSKMSRYHSFGKCQD